MAGAPPRPGILPEDMSRAPGLDYANRHLHVLQPRVKLRRRFWLEFSVLPHYPSRKERSAQRKLDRKHRGIDKSSNDYDLHDVPAVRFPQFGRLPPEIRLLVWEYALHQPRIVVITSRYEDYTPVAGSQSLSAPPPPWTPPPAELPALMMVCREAYQSALKFYERTFAWRTPHVLVDEDDDADSAAATRRLYAERARDFFGQARAPEQRPAVKKRPRLGGPGCWFNFDYDSVFLKGKLEPCLDAASTSMVYFMSPQDTTRVRYVACSADDLGVGELMASQLYAHLFAIIDRFEIKQCLTVVSAPVASKAKPSLQSEEAAKAAADNLAMAANIVLTQRNPIGTGYDSNGLPRLSDTEASCMAVNAAEIRQYSNNVCQRVWDLWTNSRNMPPLTASETRPSAQPFNGPAEDSDASERDSESECSGDHDTDSVMGEAAEETGVSAADANTATEMDEQEDAGGDGMVTDEAPAEADGNAALMDRVPYSRSRDGGPSQDALRIVMVSEDLLQSTLEAIDRVRIHASLIGTAA